MKTLLSVVLFCFINTITYTQQHSVQTKNQLCTDIGINSSPTKEPNTTLTFKTSLHDHFIYSARLRSYNSYYFVSKYAYSFSPQVEYFMHNTFSKYNFLVGVGLEQQITLRDDVRNIQSSNTTKPLITGTIMGSISCLRYQIQDRVTFYKEGIGMTLLPEIAYRSGDNFSIYARYEIGLCKLDNFPIHELKQHFFVGIQAMF